jgi:hypothetical protein
VYASTYSENDTRTHDYTVNCLKITFIDLAW